MTPYYQDDAVTIYHGDCRDVLPSIEQCGLLLTDPPYGIGGGSGTEGLKRKHRHNYPSFDDTRENIGSVVVPAVALALSACNRGIVTPGTLSLCMYPQPDSFGVFWQPATRGYQGWGRSDAQPIFYYGKDPRAGKTIAFCSFRMTDAPEINGHPCPKPYRPWLKLAERGSLPGETILDPFMGSGTTLRAAKDLGRKAIGIEIEERYCEIAAKRMQQEVLAFGARP